MSYVGLAASAGIVVEIPLVVRSLADSLGTFSDTGGKRIPLDLGLRQIIEAGADIEEFGRVVDSYAFTWWNGTTRPDVVMGHGTIDDCLKYHRKALQKRGGQRVPKLVIQPIPAVQTSAGSTSCSSCEPNRALVTALVAKVQTMKQLSSALVASKKANMEVHTRQATASFVLYEEALRKEADTAPPAVLPVMSGDSETARSSRQVRQLARETLNRSLLSPADPPHHKWTMGETLTKDEVISLASGGGHITGHSGYNLSLPDGSLAGDLSVQSDDMGSAGTGIDEPGSPTIHVSPPPTQHTIPSFLDHQEDLGDSNVQLGDLDIAGASLSATGNDVLMDDATGDHPTRSMKGKERATAPVEHQWMRLVIPDVIIRAPAPATTPSSITADVGQRWLHMVDQPTGAAIQTPPAADVGQRWLQMSSAETSDSSRIPTAVTDVGQRWLHMVDQPTGAAIQTPPAADVGQRWLQMSSAETSDSSRIPTAVTDVGQRWLHMADQPTSAGAAAIAEGTSTSIVLSTGLRHREQIQDDSDSADETSADETDNEEVAGTISNSDTGTSGASSNGYTSTDTNSSDSEETGEEDSISDHHQPTAAIEGTGTGQIIPNHSMSPSRPLDPSDFAFLSDDFFEPLYSSDFDPREVLEGID
jgi:hypothetical protein